MKEGLYILNSDDEPLFIFYDIDIELEYAPNYEIHMKYIANNKRENVHSKLDRTQVTLTINDGQAYRDKILLLHTNRNTITNCIDLIWKIEYKKFVFLDSFLNFVEFIPETNKYKIVFESESILLQD
jgi:hypothetical protein